MVAEPVRSLGQVGGVRWRTGRAGGYLGHTPMRPCASVDDSAVNWAGRNGIRSALRVSCWQLSIGFDRWHSVSAGQENYTAYLEKLVH